MVQRRYYKQIVIRYLSVPVQQETDQDAEINYVYQCLGLGSERDDVGRIVFSALVKSGMRGEGISSRDLMQLSETSQAAVIYHLNMFQRSGIVVKDGRNYFLRGGTLGQTLEELENDMHRRLAHLKGIAKKIEEKG